MDRQGHIRHRLPDEWRVDSFENIAVFRIGRTPTRNVKTWWESPDYPWVSISDMTPFGVIQSTAQSISQAAHDKVFKGNLVPAGYTLMSFKLTIGRVARLGIPAHHNEAIISFVPNPAVVDQSYLEFYLSQIDYASYRDKAIKGDTLNKSKINTLMIALPPIDEQRQIARVLSAVHRAIERQERLIALTADLKKALMHKLFTEGTRGEPLKETEIGPVPETWDKVPLGTVVDLFNGLAFKSEDAVSKSNTQLVRMGNLYSNRLDLARSPLFYPDNFADKYQRFILHEGDLIMSLTGTSGKEDFGFVVERDETSRTLLLNQRVVKSTPTSSKLLKEYLLFFLQSRKFLDHLYPTAKGMKQANLSTNAMRKLLLVIPDIAEQRQIANCFRTLDAKLELHRQTHLALSDLFRTLLHQLMTARIRVHDLDLSALDELVPEAAEVA